MSAKKGPIQITNVSVTPNPEGTKVALDPYGTSGKALRKDTQYVAVVTTGVKDLDGNRHRLNLEGEESGPPETRTRDPLIKSQLL
jgi:hypothetical protein